MLSKKFLSQTLFRPAGYQNSKEEIHDQRLRVNELTWSNSLTVERWCHRPIDTMIPLSIPLVIFSLLSTRTILRSTEHLELATHTKILH